MAIPHTNGVRRIPALNHLKVKLLDSDQVENEELMGKADCNDLFEELRGCYKSIARDYLKDAQDAFKFISGDVYNSASADVIIGSLKHAELLMATPPIVAYPIDEICANWTTWTVNGSRLEWTHWPGKDRAASNDAPDP